MTSDRHSSTPLPPPGTAAAIYARKSTDEPGKADDAKSVVRQVEHAKAYAARKGWTVGDDHVYVDDGVSGAEFTRRPGFLRLMNALSPRPPFGVLVMSEESRLGRESIETSYAIKQLIQAGVRVFYYLDDRERTLDSPTDKLLLAVSTFADEMERAKAAERVRDALIRKAQAGHVTGGSVFGYRNVRVDGHVERRIDPEEAAVVREIFRLFADGHGVRAIAGTLNAKRAIAPRSHQGRPAGWSGSTVRSVLVRRLYLGELVWNTSRKRDRFGRRKPSPRPESDWVVVPAPDLRIIPPALAARVADRFATARAAYVRNTNGTLWGRPPAGIAARYLLSGMASCGACGGAMTAHTTANGNGRRAHYRCITSWQKGAAICANRLRVRVADADRAVLDALRDDILRPDVVRDAIAEAVRRLRAAERRGDVADLRARLARVERELARLTSAVASGADAASLLAAITEREREAADVRRLIAEAEAVAKLPSLDAARLGADLERRLEDWRGVLAREPVAARQGLRKLIVGRLRFDPDPARRRYRLSGQGRLDPILAAAVPAVWAGMSPTGFEPVFPD